MSADALYERHLRMLRDESGIDESVIAERGYRSVDDSAFLAEHGFNRNQRRLGSGLFIPMYDAAGAPRGSQFRPDKPRSVRGGRIIKYETPAGSAMQLDVLPRNLEPSKDPHVELWITEGIKKSDALASIGVCAIGLIGVWNWRGRNQYGGVALLADWEYIALNGRHVVLCFDNDYRENTNVLLALHRLARVLRHRGAVVYTINLPEGPKLGVDDYLAQGHTLSDLLALKTNELPEIPKQNQAERLMSIAESYMELMYTDGGDRLASVYYADGRREVLTIGARGSSAREWLLRKYREEHKGAMASTTALAQTTEALGAYCLSHGKRVEVFTRVASSEGKLYLDLANDNGEVVEIDAKGWRILKHCDVYFTRPAGMKPLPYPEHGGSLDLLGDLFSLDNKSPTLMFIKAWLVGAMHPDGDYAILNLKGEQGSRKTGVTVVLRSTIDPNKAPVRKMPKDDEALALAAKNGRIVALDNLSYLPDWLSDDLCCLSTGYGFSRRRLYEDDTETIHSFARPVVINGISDVVTRGDLLDRILSADLPFLEDGYKEKGMVQKAFTENHPKILGALLDAVSQALAHKDTVKESLSDADKETLKTIRLNDFAVWVEAAAPALGWTPGEFLNLYAGNRKEASGVEIEASSLAKAMLEYLGEYEHFGVKGSKGDRIKGVRADDLLPCLVDVHTSHGSKKASKDFPDTGLKLGQQLKRLTPAFRKLGWDLSQPGRDNAGRMLWRCEPAKTSEGLAESNLQKSASTFRFEGQPSDQPSVGNPPYDGNIPDLGSFSEGSEGLLLYSSVRPLNEKKKEEAYSPHNDSPVEDSPDRPSEPSDDTDELRI